MSAAAADKRSGRRLERAAVWSLVGVVGFARTGAGVETLTLLAVGPMCGLMVSQLGWTVGSRLAVIAVGAAVVAAVLIGGVGVATARITGASRSERAR
jgi:hypothetical protein